MKKHISKEQLNSHPIFKAKLKHDIYYGDPIIGCDADWVLSEHGDIHEMIKMLSTEDVMITSMKPSNVRVNKSYVELALREHLEEEDIDTWFLKGFHAEELVDALFKAIEEVY